MTPLFIPLKSEYFEAFDKGTKDTEYRPHGPRWNAKTCVVGRPVILSKGYGKKHRLAGYIRCVYLASAPGTIAGWEACYGPKPTVAICIVISLHRP